jgi:hypothetical protein
MLDNQVFTHFYLVYNKIWVKLLIFLASRRSFAASSGYPLQPLRT